MTKLIQKLHNPKTELYLDLKEHILSFDFHWFYLEKSTPPDIEKENYFNVPIYSHCFLMRPEDTETKLPCPKSDFTDTATKVFLEIFESNGIEVSCFFRLNANCVHPTSKVVNSVPHRDHSFEHKNAIIYLTPAGGSTVVEDESYSPEEDDVILFDGATHYLQTPKDDRRVVLIATFV